jgi:hypothetical protein
MMGTAEADRLSKDLSLAFYGFNQLLYGDVDKGFSEIVGLQYMTL